MFLVGTGVRVSEMLGILLSDIKVGKGTFAEVRVIGKGSKERAIHVKKEFIERIKKHFHGTTRLFEHQGKPFNRISVTNRIKHEALRTIGREVTAQQLATHLGRNPDSAGKGYSGRCGCAGTCEPRGDRADVCTHQARAGGSLSGPGGEEAGRS